MDRKQLLAERQNQHKQCTKNIKDFLGNVIDDQSFVESNEFFASENGGKSVVWGQASIGGKLVFVVAQNSEVTQGGMNKQQAEKFVKACNVAYDNNLPTVFVLDSCGGKIDEGVALLDSYASILASAKETNQPSICIIKGNALGSMALFASLCDFVYMTSESVMAINSPSVLSAQENLSGDAKSLFGAKLQNENGACTFVVKKEELGSHLSKLLDTLYSVGDELSEADLNKALGKIEGANAKDKIKQLADKDSFIECYEGYAQNVVAGLAKIGGYSVGIVATDKNVCNGTICSGSLDKISKIADLCYLGGFPLITLVDCPGVPAKMTFEESSIYSIVPKYIQSIEGVRRISVITGDAIGLGYTLLASKSLGCDSVIAWESAVVAPVAKEVGGVVVYNNEIAKAENPVQAREDAIAKYEQVDSDPYFAAEKGLIDKVIEAKYTRIHLIAELQAIFNK